MRVISGIARGTKLEPPKKGGVRPTTDRVRESIFNIISPRIPGAQFLDLYAGTGANGIEALSRGAAGAVFVDADSDLIALIGRNLQRSRTASKAQCRRLVLPQGLSALDGAAFDIIFADPPYEEHDPESLLETIGRVNLLKPGGLIVLEHDARWEASVQIGPYTHHRTATYGRSAVSFFA